MTYAIDIHLLNKTYLSGHVALKDVSFQVKSGDFFALLGPNGAGKSTLISILTSLCQKTSGQVKVFGFDLDRQLNQAKACIGVVPQELNFNPYDKVLDIVINQAGYYGIARAQAKPLAIKYLEQLGLGDKCDKPAIALSGGMKRRVMIARALVHQPKLLILDEPTAGVDIELRRSLWDFLTEINHLGTTIVLTTHYLEEAENLCRNIAIINQGKILKNTSMAELLQTVDKEAFIFYTDTPLHSPPILSFDARVRCLDAYSFEVMLARHDHLNQVFSELSAQGIRINSMRNKTNRLEALFVDLISQA
jgi:ABC-2 type transport system ATP-binding protein